MRLIKQSLVCACLAALLLGFHAGSAEPTFKNTKANAVYAKINAKIAKLERERTAKLARIKAKGYDPAREKSVSERLNLKIDRAIQRYKDKGNRYFRRLGLPEPWAAKPAPNAPPPTTGEFSPSAETNSKRPLETAAANPPPAPQSPQSAPVEIDTSAAPRQAESDNSVPITPAPAEQRHPPQASSAADVDNISAPAETRNGHGSKGAGWRIAAAAAVALLSFLAVLWLIILAATWKRTSKILKAAFGCATLLSAGAAATVLIASLILFSKSSSSGGGEPAKLFDKHLSGNASLFHNLGANLFAEAVAEGDREKLFEAVDYLEKAAAGAPDAKGVTVDLADAYMELDSPSATAWAIELYESVFDSFDDDPLLARITAGYYQLRNYDAAMALAKKRMESCPPRSRRAAAMQMAFIAFSSGAEREAEAAILADAERRGADPMLSLTVATLREARGDKRGALAAIDAALADPKAAPEIKAYVEKVGRRIANE